MGKLFVTMFSTLDGVMQGPGGPGEDTEGGFTQSGWQAPFANDGSGAIILESILAMDALLIGRKTYDIWVNHWPQARDAIGDHFNRIPKYVASRTLNDPTWSGTTVLRDVPRAVAELKAAHGETRVWGSGELLTALLGHDLVDQIDLFVYPVVLGSGKRVFRDGTLPAAFELLGDPRGFSGGSVLQSYRRAGNPAYGSMSD
ncbi:MAG: dihydrofolate reductase family protein [Pseudolysinimonas sp.]|uniref:dihydrofolate reductase family protein n=1 Tax=Pseudolysinimonas sp. TaxID=2680009 RepID=UPI00326693B5